MAPAQAADAAASVLAEINLARTDPRRYARIIAARGAGHILGGFDQSGHRLAGLHPRVGEGRDGGHIVAGEHAAFRRGPGQHCRVVGASQAGVVQANDVQTGVTPQQAAEDCR